MITTTKAALLIGAVVFFVIWGYCSANLVIERINYEVTGTGAPDTSLRLTVGLGYIIAIALAVAVVIVFQEEKEHQEPFRPFH